MMIIRRVVRIDIRVTRIGNKKSKSTSKSKSKESRHFRDKGCSKSSKKKHKKKRLDKIGNQPDNRSRPY